MARRGKSSKPKSLVIINNLYRMLISYPSRNVNVSIRKKKNKPYVEVNVWYTVSGFNVDRKYYVSEKFLGYLRKRLSDAYLERFSRIGNRFGYEYEEHWIGVHDRIDRVLKIWDIRRKR